jgi:hypothetical protein
VIIILDGKEYAVGLNWFAITSTDEVQQFQKEMELTHGILKYNKDPALPSTVALAGSEYEGQLSLAGMLSYAYENLLYVAKTNNKTDDGAELYYLCTVKHGAVSVEGDVIADLETIKALYAANLAEISAEIDPSDIQRFGTDVEEEDFAGITLVDFSTFLEPAQRYAGQCIVKVLAKEGLSKQAIAMVVIIFILGGYLAYAWLFKKPPPPPVTVVEEEYRPAPAPRQPERDPYEVFLEQMANRLSSQPEPEIVPELVTAVKQLPLVQNGWELNYVAFDGKNLNNLSVNFKRQPYSNINEVLELADKGFFTNMQIGPRGDCASAQYPLTQAGATFIDLDTIKALAPGSEENYYNMLSTLQSYGMSISKLQSTSNKYVAENGFSLSGDGLWSLQRTANILSAFNTLALESLEIRIENGNYNWIFKGVIYG